MFLFFILFLFFSFDPFSKKHGGSSVNREKEKLLHKMKREKKSAKKELRKDTAFLAKQKFREIRERCGQFIFITNLILKHTKHFFRGVAGRKKHLIPDLKGENVNTYSGCSKTGLVRNQVCRQF